MNKRTILLVIEGTYPWYRGGVSEWVHQYLQHIDEYHFHILQVATDQYLNSSVNDALYDIADHVQGFERIPPPNLSNDWREESISWKKDVQVQLSDTLFDVDLVHIANTGFAGWLGKEIATERQKPLLLTEHALYWKEVDMGAVALECGYKIPDSEDLKKRYVTMFQNMARDIYTASDQVISVSECNIPNQRQMGAQDVQYIPNGIPDDWVRTSQKELHDPLTVGWIGRCAEMKNPLKFFDLTDAFRNISQEVQFLMLSCDANEPELAREVKAQSAQRSNVELVWNQSTANYIDRMDVLCITSHNESQPLVLFEALARQVLPVGWKAGDVTEKYGFIFDRSVSADILASKIWSLWQDHYRWRREVEDKAKMISRKHTWDIIFTRYRTAFNSLLTSSK